MEVHDGFYRLIRVFMKGLNVFYVSSLLTSPLNVLYIHPMYFDMLFVRRY